MHKIAITSDIPQNEENKTNLITLIGTAVQAVNTNIRRCGSVYFTSKLGGTDFTTHITFSDSQTLDFEVWTSERGAVADITSLLKTVIPAISITRK